MTRSVPHAEPFVSAVPKLLDVVNVPRRILLRLCVSANYHSSETNARRGGRDGEQHGEGTNVQTQGIIGTTYRANNLALARH